MVAAAITNIAIMAIRITSLYISISNAVRMARCASCCQTVGGGLGYAFSPAAP